MLVSTQYNAVYPWTSCLFRHPEASERPSFTSLVFKLSQPENQLLLWKETYDPDSQSTLLGAPLETVLSNQNKPFNQGYNSRS